MRGCPCGYLGSDHECRCTPLQVQAYRRRISGPLLDRMDLHVEVPRIQYEDLHSRPAGASSQEIRNQVSKAREIQARRFEGCQHRVNAEMTPAEVRRYCQLDHESEDLLKNAFIRLRLSARAYDKVLKVSRTIADLEGCESISMNHLAEALQYRSLDRSYWNY